MCTRIHGFSVVPNRVVRLAMLAKMPTVSRTFVLAKLAKPHVIATKGRIVAMATVCRYHHLCIVAAKQTVWQISLV